MLPNIIGVLLLLLVVWIGAGVIFRGGTTEEAFSFPVSEHQEYVEESQKKLNSLTNMINLTDPVLPVKVVTAQDMYGATHGVKPQPTATEYALSSEPTFKCPMPCPPPLRKPSDVRPLQKHVAHLMILTLRRTVV